MKSAELYECAMAALNRVAKWRSVFAGWQLGTRAKGDPESDAVRDHREATILLRVEVTALGRLLIAKGLVTFDEFYKAQIEEAEHLERAYEKKFPGIKAVEDGMSFSKEAVETMKGWRP